MKSDFFLVNYFDEFMSTKQLENFSLIGNN
jgi:hypothetical protein